jgi:signal transduction histidine kinase
MEKLFFKTNILLKDILGKELINNDNIAILELVKNSFDSLSRKAIIKFVNIKTNDDKVVKEYSDNSSKIIIQDSGRGMNREDIKEKWLNIAYSEKKKKSVIEGRGLAGAKGIGRFSCDRLGEFLDIYTKKRGHKMFHLRIDWKKFEKDKREMILQKEPVYIEILNKKEFGKKTSYEYFEHGTLLEISKLRSNWNKEDLMRLRTYLEKLINPNQPFSNKKFTIVLEADEFREEEKKEGLKINGIIENKIFERLEFKTTFIESSISSDGKDMRTILRDRGNIILEIEEENPFKLLRDVKIIIYFLNSYAKAYFKRQTNIESKNFGSLFLFRNGFRISPYGDEGNDWLGLEIRKGQGMRRNLGTRDVIGRIEINDPKNLFKEVSSREGLVEDERFRELTNSRRGYFITTLRRLEKYVVSGLNWDSVPEGIQKKLTLAQKKKDWSLIPSKEEYTESEDQKRRRALKELTSIIGLKKDIRKLYINTDMLNTALTEEKEKLKEIIDKFKGYDSRVMDSRTFRSLSHLKKIFDKKERELEDAKELISEQSEEIEKLGEELDEKNEALEIKEKESLFLNAVSNVETKEIVGLQHQIGLSTSTIRNYLEALKQKILREKEVSSEYMEEIIKKMGLENEKIASIVNFITKANYNLTKSEIKTDLVNFIEQYISNVYVKYKNFTQNYPNLKVSIIHKDVEFPQKFRPLEIVILIDNLMSNALKANAKTLEIIFKKRTKKEIEIIFRDDGKGIPQKYLDRVFDLGFTTTLGGSGTGLYHVKEIVKRLGGEITINDKIKKGTEFIITIKK